MPFNLIKLLRTLLFCACIFTGALACGQNGASLTRLKTVVIDPGHGGHDAGCISKNGKYKEKNIALSVSLKLGAMIKEKYPQIRVIYTRSTDKFVELNERASIANRNKADLFISVHVNSTKSTQASGTETWVMGIHKSESNFELCKAENSVITLESNYESKYEGFDPNSPESYIIFSLLQNTHLEQSLQLAGNIQKHFRQGPIYADRGVKQGGLIVLWKSTMPAVLVEIGFLSNPKDYNILINKEKHGVIAQRIFQAFESYKKDYEAGAGFPATASRPDNRLAAATPEKTSRANMPDNARTESKGTENKRMENKTAGHKDTDGKITGDKTATEKAAANKATNSKMVRDKTINDKTGNGKAPVNSTTHTAAGNVKNDVSAGAGVGIGNGAGNKEMNPDGPYFSIQILSVNKILKSNAPDLKGRKNYTYIKVGNVYKYMMGKYASRNEAAGNLPAVRKTFPGAFIIQIKDGKIVK